MADISAQPIPDFGSLISSYGQNQANIGLTNAQTGVAQAQPALLGAQTGLATAQTGVQNATAQKTMLEVAMLKKAMAAGGQTPLDNSQDDQSAVDPTEAGIASYFNHKWFVDPKGPASLQQYLDPSWAANPMTAGIVTRADEVRKIAIASQTAQYQNEATDTYNTATALAGTDHALASLMGLKDGTPLKTIGLAINSDPNKSPEEKEQAASVALKSAAKYAFQHTGQEPTVEGDQVRSKQTGLPVTGTPEVNASPDKKLSHKEFQDTPQTVTSGNSPTTRFPGQSVSGGSNTPPASGSPQAVQKEQAITQALTQKGFQPEQASFVAKLPDGYTAPPDRSQWNPVQKEQFDTWNKQQQDSLKSTNLEYTRATDVVTHIKQIQSLLQTPGLTLGPGSAEKAQLQTFFNQWFGTSAGQAGAYQVLSKVLNTTEMNDLLQQFHSEGAQVRLGAYESKLIMDKLTASPALTKEAIQQMLQWQGSDSQYTIQKAKVAGAAVAAKKDVGNFDKDYGSTFPKQDIVDTTAGVLHAGSLDFSGAKGKTYSTAEVSKAAAQKGIPLVMFQDQLTKAGATIK